MQKQFSVKETAIYAVRSVLDHPWYVIKLFFYWIGFALVLMLPILALIKLMTVYGWLIPKSINRISFVCASIGIIAVYLLAMIYIWLAPIKFLLHFYDTKSSAFSFGSFFKIFSFAQLFKLLGTFIIYLLVIILGFILFIVPGIYFAVKLQFALYYVIDKNMSVMDAFKKSYAATTGNFWRILCVDVIASLFMQLIITVPVSYLMSVYTYRKLG